MYILVDIGGTNIRVAGSKDLATTSEPAVFDTPQDYDDALKKIAERAEHIAGESAIERLVVGVPATLSRDKRLIIGSALNIPAWKGKSIAGDLETLLRTRAFCENDAALVGLGEAHFGAGKGAEIFAYVTVSTGVNGARIVGGKVDVSAFGFSTGHQYVSSEEPPRTWEQMISGRAIRERFGVAPRELGKEHAVWEELARTVAVGLHNSIVHWSPDKVALGGSMFNDIGIPLERVKFHLERITGVANELTEIVHSQLGDTGGLWGGVALLRQTA